MSLYSNTLAVTRQYVSAAVGDLILSTPSSASSVIALDTKLRKGDDYYNEHHYRGYCYEGTAIGQEREVSDFSAVGTVTFAPAFSPALTTGDELEFHHIFTEDEYRKSINLSIDSLKDGKYLIDLSDETIPLVADTYEYTLPTTMRYVHRIITEETAGGSVFNEADEIDPRDWRLISSRKVKLDEDRYSVSAGKYLRIEGQSAQATVGSDTAIIALPSDWLVQKAITFLPKNKIESNKLDDTYRQALVLSAKEPRAWPNPRGRRVLE